MKKNNDYQKIIKKYQQLNDFTLSRDDLALYRNIKINLEMNSLSLDDSSIYHHRFNNQVNQIDIKNNDDLILISNVSGGICYGNSSFYQYSLLNKELVEKNPGKYLIKNLRHPDMPSSIYKDLWVTIVAGKMWSGIICNRNLKNQDYWQFVNIFPILEGGKIVNYIAFNKAAPTQVVDEVILLYRVIP